MHASEVYCFDVKKAGYRKWFVTSAWILTILRSKRGFTGRIGRCLTSHMDFSERPHCEVQYMDEAQCVHWRSELWKLSSFPSVRLAQTWTHTHIYAHTDTQAPLENETHLLIPKACLWSTLYQNDYIIHKPSPTSHHTVFKLNCLSLWLLWKTTPPKSLRNKKCLKNVFIYWWQMSERALIASLR